MKKRADQEREITSSMRASIKDGVSHAVMLGCGESYFGAFAIFLKASTLQVGLIATLPQLFGAIMQWVGAINLDHYRSRRRIVILGASTQAFTLIPMAFIPFAFWTGDFAILLFLAFVMIYHGANVYVVPAWNSLIGDLVKPDIRGQFFGDRNRLTGMSTFTSLFVAGVILHFFEKAGIEEVGFLFIFLAAFFLHD
jgi:hypothetical protein